MNQTLRKALLVTIAAPSGLIVGIAAALLTHFGGGHIRYPQCSTYGSAENRAVAL